MNRSGHIATALLIGSAVSYLLPERSPIDGVFLLAGAAIGGLLPDLDHKTSTLSNTAQFSAATRRRLKGATALFVLLGGLMYLCNLGSPWWAISAALACAVAANTRMLILSGAGVLLLAWYALHPLHWIILLVGGALLILPFVRHRGIIHSPEFAMAMSAGGLTLTLPQQTHMLVLGLLAGWWAHLAGDALTTEGIRSLLFPRLKVALKVVRNGGTMEKSIAAMSWLLSIGLWIQMYM